MKKHKGSERKKEEEERNVIEKKKLEGNGADVMLVGN